MKNRARPARVRACHLRLQQSYESFLLKVVIGGQSFSNPLLTHQKKADGITQRIGLVKSRL